MRVSFIGCVKSSEVALKALIDLQELGIEVVGLVTKESTRFNSDFVDLSNVCTVNNIPTFYWKSGADKEMYKFLKTASADVIFCVGWSHLLNEEILQLPSRGLV